MKSKHLLKTFLFGSIVLASCNQTPKVLEGEFLIEGELKNVPDSVVIELLKEDGELLITVKKDTVIHGAFSFRDTISGNLPRKYLLLSDADGFPGTWLDIWTASGQYVKIKGQDKLLPLWNVSSKIPEQQYDNEFKQLSLAERKESLELQTQEYDLFRLQATQGADMNKIDSLRKLYAPLDSLIYLSELNYMKAAPVTTVWLEKYNSYCSFLQWNTQFGHQELIRSLYARMSEADKATKMGQEITGYINLPQPVNVGEDMVDGDLYDLDGKVRHISEYKGKYILLDFWSQGCGPCIQSLPEIEEIAKVYKEKMEIISINQDSEKKWKQFISDKKLTGNQWNELRNGNTGLAAVYQVLGIPHYVMISPEGKVIDIWEGYGEGSLKAKMKELIK